MDEYSLPRALHDAIERQQAEMQVRRQSMILDAINRVFRETLTCETAEEVARACLAVAEELTGSAFGFIGEVNSAGRFDTIALSDPGWEACRMPRSNALVVIRSMEIRGLWGGVLREERCRIINDPATHPDRVGLPEGHPPLTAFLGVPLKQAGKTFGLIALANKEGGYDLADQQAVEALSVAFVEALNRKRAESALRMSEQRYRTLFEGVPVGLYRTTPDGRILDANPALVRMLGYPDRESLLAVNAADIHVDPEQRREEYILLEREGAVHGFKTQLRRYDGTTIWVQDTAQATRGADGRVLYVEGGLEEITERLRAEEEIRQRTAQLEALRAVGLELAAELNLDDLLNSIVARAVSLAGGTSGGLYLYRPEQDVIEWAVSVGPTMAPIGTVLHRGEGLSGRAWETGEPLVVDDYQHWEGRAAIYDGYPFTCTLAIPVRWGDEFLGVLNVLGDAPGALSPADVKLLSLFATQAAMAIHNARLFQSERAARERAEKLQAATQALSATLDLRQVFQLILNELRHVVPYDSASVQQLKGEQLEIIGGHGFPNLEDLLGERFDLANNGNPNREVVRTRAPLILDDAPAVYAGFRREPHAQAQIRSWLGVPLLFGERLIGMIALDKREAGFYTQEHACLAMAFAAQAAIAIENARLYQEAQQRLRELALLSETSTALSMVLDVDTVVQTMARYFIAALGVEDCAISLWEQEQDSVVTLLDYSTDPEWQQPEPPGTVYHLANFPVTRQVLASRQCLAVQAGDPDAEPGELAWMTDEGVRSLLLVPLVAGDEVIGLAELMETERARAFTSTEIALCQTLANQGAAALENARLYTEARRRNRELGLLNRIIAASAASQAIEPILETVCRELALALDVPQSAAALFDAERTEAVVVAEYLAEGRPPALGEIIPVAGNPASQYLLQHKAPLVVDDAQTDPRLAPIHDLMRRRGTVSLLLLPLLDEGEVVGSLGLDAIEPRPFSAEEVDLARRVAEQVSSALARVRLEEAQRRLSTAVEQTAESIVVTAIDGTILYVNPALERISGYSRAEMLGGTLQILHSGKHDSAFYDQMQRTIAAGLVWQGRHISRRKDGSLYTEDMTITPVRNQAGEVVNYVATMRDVTREVELEEQFRQAQKMEAVGRLAGGVAHDFNNLMTVIHLSCRLMERKLHPEDTLWLHVQRIRETGERATALTKQLLAFSRQEMMEPKVLNLHEVVVEMNKMLDRIIGEDIELITCLAQEPWLVYADPTQIEQVILNLAVNARDAMPDGGTLTVSTANVLLDEAYTRQHLEVRPGEYAMLTVSDTGVGMDESARQHLFEPFFTTKARGKGTGLGLAMVFGIVKQHGGHIQVDSKMGQGTTVCIYLPRTERTKSEQKPLPGGEHLPLPGSPPRATETLLLVEDEAGVRDLVAQSLGAQGYQVLLAASGQEALQLSQEHDGPIDLLLTDVVMPHMSGPELAERLTAQRPEVRVLYMSGYANDTTLQRRVLNGEVALLSKPFSVEQLMQKVRVVLEGKA